VVFLVKKCTHYAKERVVEEAPRVYLQDAMPVNINLNGALSLVRFVVQGGASKVRPKTPS
jgi:hypothetical protein